MFTSIKQSLIILGDSLVLFYWSYVQQIPRSMIIFHEPSRENLQETSVPTGKRQKFRQNESSNRIQLPVFQVSIKTEYITVL